MPSSNTQRLGQAGRRSTVAMDTASAEQSGASSPQRRNDESWVEVSSQPSSSSLSSIDDMVTAGFHGPNSAYPRRRRVQPQPHSTPATFIIGHSASQAGATSSQEEYDETESEEDRVMTSSTEAIHPSAVPLLRHQTALRPSLVADSDRDDDDDDDEATALGRPSNTPVFRPQPNAFSHPPSYLTQRNSTGFAPLPYQHHSSHSRPSYHSTRTQNRGFHRGSPDYFSPAYQADHDAALRASLTTLLSCAAAARGLPKHDERRVATAPGAGGATGPGLVPSNQPMELRLVPESELMNDNAPTQQQQQKQPSPSISPVTAKTTTTTQTSSSSSSPRTHPKEDKTKRSATPSSRAAAAAAASSASRKKRTSTTDATTPFLASVVSPTILPWVVSAGLVVLVSVVGFGAGYVIGREVGRQEGASAMFGGSDLAGESVGNVTSGAGCAGEVVKFGPTAGGLRRFRWGGVRSVAA
ncbi:hypothetical protein VTJ04DRAFT_3191 [Mycothermus thermophilus]|uniref:uncharacterized protein n=1 Tax=Humicola insolens TaxID=85995 RepID=UPI003742F314